MDVQLKVIGQAVAEARVAAGQSFRVAADAIGISVNTLRSIEAGNKAQEGKLAQVIGYYGINLPHPEELDPPTIAALGFVEAWMLAVPDGERGDRLGELVRWLTSH